MRASRCLHAFCGVISFAGRVAGLACFALLLGCHPFEHHWQQAAELAPSVDAELAGRWAGHWYSHDNGHNGPLRAIITVPACPASTEAAGSSAARPTNTRTYRVQWHAVYAGFLQFGIDTPLLSEPQPEPKRGWDWRLTGREDLGVWGVFEYTGTATRDELIVDYVSPLDRGVFRLERVPVSETEDIKSRAANSGDARP